MPLTPAEKQKRYREKLQKENPEKYALMKKKTAECALRYYRKKTNEYTEQDREERRQKWRDERKNLKQAQDDEARKNLNNSENVQIHAELRKENYVIKREIVTLRKTYQALRKKYYRQSIKMQELNKAFQELKENYQEITTRLKEQNCMKNEESEVMCVDDETPIKQTETFIKKYLSTINESQKQIVKKKILEHNVLAKSLKEEYKKSIGTEKNTLKKIVTNEIVKKYKLKDKLRHTLGLKCNIRKNRYRKIKKNKILNEINTFYNRDDNSRATAGKKECKTKNKIKLQRRYLLTTIKKLHEKYTSEGGKASLSTFKKYRPFNILTPKISDRDTCACVKHCNMAFMVKKLKQLGILENDDLNNLMSNLVCDVTSKTCMYGLCESCKDNIITANETDLNLNDKIVWPFWVSKKHEYGEEGNKKTTKKMEKAEREGSIQDLINIINSDLKKFLNHSYNISHQYKNYKFCIANLKENETVIHIDFSENYICKMHTEVQAMHFGSSKVQVTLHTGVLYIKNENKPISFCSISPANIHKPEAIWAHLKPILQYLKEAFPQVDTIHFFSDGPTSQYRNKKNFYLFSQIQSFGFNHATWSIFEASHGKGAADGIGGAVKRTLDSKVAHGEDIPDAKTAFEVLSKTDSVIKVFYIPPEDIKLLPDEIVKKLNPLPNTLKIHQVILNEKHSVRYRDLSCFCNNMSGRCHCYSIKMHNFEIRNVDLPKSKRTQKNKTKKKDTRKIKRRDSSSSTSVESCEIKYLDDSDATHFSEPEYLEEEYLDVEEGENLEEGFTLEKERFEGDVQTKQERKSAAQKGVTILSEVRNLPCNKRYIDIKQFDRLESHKLDLTFDLFSAKKSPDVIAVKMNAENIDPYANPVASTSGINRNCCLINTKVPDCSIKFIDLSKEDRENTQRKVINESEIKEMENTDVDSLTINENKNTEDCEEYKNETNVKYIKINQNVLVRYYIRNNWKYYVGRVSDINIVEEKYTVDFLKTVKNPSLKFVMSKKIDRDTVPSVSIVKTIELVTSNKKNEYMLGNNFDNTYFI